MFEFKVQKRDNRAYCLHQGSATWFPAYQGKIWIDKATLRLMKVERETFYDENAPITQMKTSIDYAVIALGDGTNFVLPSHADVRICIPSPDAPDNCWHNIITFSNWHKFRATTNIVFSPVN